MPEYENARRLAWAKKNPQKRKEAQARYYLDNVDTIRSKNREHSKKFYHETGYYEKHKDKIKHRAVAYNRHRRNTDMPFKILCHLRRRLHKAIKENRKHSRTASLLGCSIADFMIYLESKFESGMTWQNYGYQGWHVDHIMPCAIFDFSKAEHQKRCFHFSNLQPMWGHQNMRKQAKVTDNQFSLL